MRHPDDRPPLTRGVVLRMAIFALSIALSAVAVWLVVSSANSGPDSVRRVQLGVLAGLWAAMLGAFAMFGTRRLHPVDTAAVVVPTGSELAVRSERTELERAEEAAARRAHEARLEHMLRREIQTTVGREVDGLRAEIAQLRGDLLEKVGGQLRLERIETTRVIGSDLEALQHELRELKYATQDSGELRVSPSRPAEPHPLRQIVEPARVRPVSRETADVEAEVLPARPPAREAERPAPPAPAPVRVDTAPPPPRAETPPPPPPRAETPPPPPPRAETPPPPLLRSDTTGPIRMPRAPYAPGPFTPAPAPEPRRQPSGAPPPVPPPSAPVARPPAPAAAPLADDGFAALPRIRPFTEFELDPVEDEPSYTGRRRRVEDTGLNGRHAQPTPPAPPPAQPTPPAPPPARSDDAAGQRHRREGDNGNDLLARLLAREGG